MKSLLTPWIPTFVKLFLFDFYENLDEQSSDQMIAFYIIGRSALIVLNVYMGKKTQKKEKNWRKLQNYLKILVYLPIQKKKKNLEDRVSEIQFKIEHFCRLPDLKSAWNNPCLLVFLCSLFELIFSCLYLFIWNRFYAQNP